MKFILPETRFAKTCVTALFAALLLTTGLQAQTRKKTASTPAKKTVAKKTAAPVKDARKSNKKETVAKKSSRDDKKKATAKSNARDNKRDSRKDREQARRDSKRDSKKEKATAKKDSRDKDSKKPDKKQTARERRAEEARRKREEARRQAAIEAERRRQEAIRIARERKLAFERGLRETTARNILNDNTEGEDPTVRRAAIDALGNRAGTVVVMEAKTGKVVSMVNQEWAIKQSFKPCSTIKLVTGVAGLNEGVIEGDDGIDWALARSSNSYFQRKGVKFGTPKMIEYAKSLGLGEKTGINAEGETPGKLPYGNRNPRIYSHGDDFEVTPLQLAVMVSAISNDGKRVVPQIVRQQNQKVGFRPKFREDVKVPYRTVQEMIPGMIGAAEYGTAHRGVDHNQGIAGKTGSCIFKGSWIGLFASVAPVEDPQYSVVVITRGESERGKYAAAVAGNVYRALAPRLRRDQDRYLALKNLRPAPNTENLAVGDDEEDDDDETAATAAAPTVSRPVIIAGASAKQADEPKKLIQRTGQSRPTNFAPVVIEYDKEKAARGEKTVKTRERIVKQ